MLVSAMCLSLESCEKFIDYLYGLEDEELSTLAKEYRDEAGIIYDTVHDELRHMVMNEYEQRRQRKIRRLNRAMWLSSRRGRLTEKIRKSVLMLVGHQQTEKFPRT
jgi:hypothetical protein